MYFPESVIITTSDGIQFKTFSNSHPEGFIIAKPKYIPVDEVFCKNLRLANIFNKEFNRMDFWSDQQDLKYYIDSFNLSYPQYRIYSENHHNWFFAIPVKKIKKIFDPREGLKSLIKKTPEEHDHHISKVIRFAKLITKSGVSINNLGITFSTLVGHYDPNYSDINIVIYGKKNAWKVINFLDRSKDPLLRWKSSSEWENFRNKRDRKTIFTREEFAKQMSRKRTEGFYDNTLFVLFPVEKENEIWEKWDKNATYEPLGYAEIEGTVTDNFSSIVRPGFYDIKNSKILKGYKNVPVKKVVFYSRDYVMQVMPGEKLKAYGLLERVKESKKKEYYRLVIGYFNSYLGEKRGKEYIKSLIK